MVFSTRLAHVLNQLITSLTTYLSNSREHVAKSGKIRQKTDRRENSGHFPILSYFQKKIRMNILSAQSQGKLTTVS